MNELLINGCSYTVNWSPLSGELGTQLGFTTTTNLSLAGSSNDRIFRTTLDYLLTHKVDYVILALTFWDRQEAPWAKLGIWTDYSHNGLMRASEVRSPELYDAYIQDRYRYDIDINYVGKLLDSLITFTGWLDSQAIKYLVFTSSGNYFHYPVGTIVQTRLDYLKTNPRIIDIECWNSNQYMHNHGGIGLEQDWPPDGRHYTSESFSSLNKFIINYINENNLI